MNKATLQRTSHGYITFGKLLLHWLPEHEDIHTIELGWNNNEPGISCIPQGLYNVTTYSSLKFNLAFKIHDVPGRKNILIHIGNFANDGHIGNLHFGSDTNGCVCIGLKKDTTVPMVKKSKAAMLYLHQLTNGENFSLEVKN